MSESYGGLPAAPPPPPQGYGDQPVDRGARPKTVTYAVYLMYLRVVISIIGLIVTAASKDDLKKRILEDSPNTSQSTIDAAVTVGIVIGVVFTLLYAGLALMVGRGKNWARIVTWVLAGLGVLSALLSFGQTTTPGNRILGVLDLIIDVGIIVLLAVSSSHPWFRKQHRSAY